MIDALSVILPKSCSFFSYKLLFAISN